MTTVASTTQKGAKEHVQIGFNLASLMSTSGASDGFIAVGLACLVLVSG